MAQALGGRARRMWQDASVSAVVAGAVAVVVSFAGPLTIVVQAAHAGDLDEARLSSWIWAIAVGSGVTGFVLSLRLRVPVVAAWSTPGAALLVTQLDEVPYATAIGAYLAAAALTVLVGVTGWFDALMRRIPGAVVSAVLAGILLRFGLDAFRALESGPAVAGVMLAGYVVCQRVAPRYAIAAPLAAAVAVAGATGTLSLGGTQLSLAAPVFTTPAWPGEALVSLTLPLFLVTMSAQNAPGVGALREAGYAVPSGRLVRDTGVASAVFAPFGAHAINLGAITAAICAGPDAHEDRARRYVAGLSCGVFYVVVGLCGATVAGLFAALPQELISAAAGVALLGALGGSISTAFTEADSRTPAIVAFLTTASGLTLWGLGAALWGLVFGMLCRVVLKKPEQNRNADGDRSSSDLKGRQE
ncbi:benzoate/H(+) symporter BenE family transporter [Streptomyces sp. Je 1-369]|uniref:benzoate/H(+) symporter BenE family transporter n=1 Tax=Streptomyces sp. Je 1-369 TaxID=2966192 RepID=UPI0022855A0D|nr:benzoate/H(+) symporter BenE family transporter [Streptomyces sp. Je 1-369]WAL99474.1 benzoate/H(+) symporter BenE family transporter [Streptomyces sp. Je 1-369]